MQESDFGKDFFDTSVNYEGNSFHSFSSSSTPEPPGLDSLSLAHRLGNEAAAVGINTPVKSKSNTNSPVKPNQDVPRLVRSMSAENLLSVRRQLVKDLDGHPESSRNDFSMDLMASQLTNLHMT